VLACHQHVLADIGKDLLEPSHAALLELFKGTGVRQKLRELAWELGREIGAAIEETR
jgi:hypothetical protein